MQTQTQNNEPNAVETARNKIGAIQQAIVGGDKTLTARDLASAKAALEFAELQQAAREIVKQTNLEAERKTTLLNLQKELASVSDSRKTVDAKFTAFQKALSDYLTSASNYQNSLDAVRNSLRSNGMHPGEQTAIINGVGPGASYFGITVTDVRRKLEIGEVSAENVLPNDVVKPLIEQALGEYNRHF
jgi:uncharacterized protein YlxW (UPF0749 family)